MRSNEPRFQITMLPIRSLRVIRITRNDLSRKNHGLKSSRVRWKKRELFAIVQYVVTVVRQQKDFQEAGLARGNEVQLYWEKQ